MSLVEHAPVLSLVEHARRELDLCGQTAEDPGYAASVVAAVAGLMSWGHSGGSMSCALDQLMVLLKRGTLSPLTDDPDEWLDRTEMSGYPVWQNERCPVAFSTDGGKTFYLLPDTDGGLPPIEDHADTGHVDAQGHRLWRSAPARAVTRAAAGRR